MKAGECIYRDGLRISAENSKLMSLEEAIVKSADPLESIDCHSKIWIVLDTTAEYNAVAYKVRDEYKAKVKTIADFIDHNKGKRLLEILEMDLP